MTTTPDAGLTSLREETKAEFERRRGYWAPQWQFILDLHPEFLAAYTNLSAYAAEHGGLEQRTRELIYMATSASVTHQHPPGIRVHGRNALREGATPQQLLAVLELVSTLGVATVHLTVQELEALWPGTVDELAAEDGVTPAQVSDVLAQFQDVYSIPADGDVTDAIRAVPEFYRRLLEIAAIPRHSTELLSPKEVALISLAVNALVTHLDPKALRRDLLAARNAGATAAEVIDVCMQIAVIGVHSITVGVPILAELMEEAGAAHSPAGA